MGETLNVVMAGARLAAVGMATVFVFLTTLVIATTAMSALVRRFVPPAVALSKTPPRGPSAAPELVAVLTAAIHAHRSRINQPRP